MTTSNIETSFKVNYPGGFFDFSCSSKKIFIDRNNLLNTRVVGLEDPFDYIDCILSVWYLNILSSFVWLRYLIEDYDWIYLLLGPDNPGIRCHHTFNRHLRVIQSVDGLRFSCYGKITYIIIFILILKIKSVSTVWINGFQNARPEKSSR